MKKILFAEDDSTLSGPLSDALHEEGFDVTVASDGGSAIKQALSGTYDLLLLDVNLPAITGITILEKVREQSWGEQLPAIFLTAEDTSEEMFDAITRLAPKYYLMKGSASLNEIIDAIHQSLGSA